MQARKTIAVPQKCKPASSSYRFSFVSNPKGEVADLQSILLTLKIIAFHEEGDSYESLKAVEFSAVCCVVCSYRSDGEYFAGQQFDPGPGQSRSTTELTRATFLLSRIEYQPASAIRSQPAAVHSTTKHEHKRSRAQFDARRASTTDLENGRDRLWTDQARRANDTRRPSKPHSQVKRSLPPKSGSVLAPLHPPVKISHKKAQKHKSLSNIFVFLCLLVANWIERGGLCR